MDRALFRILVCVVCAMAVACGGTDRGPGSTADANDSLLTFKARILRAEDRRVVDDDLLAALQHPQPVIRALAVRALGRIEDRQYAGQLEQATTDDDSGVRAAAAFAIGLLGDPAAIDQLEVLGQDGSAEVRSATAIALGLIGADEGQGTIMALVGDSENTVATSACFAIPRFEHPGFAVARLDELSRGDRPEVVFASTWALSTVASTPERLDRQTRRTARDRMVELTQSRFNVMRRMAARGLRVPTREEEAASVGPLVEDPDPTVRIAAIRAISFPGAPLEPFLTKVLLKGEDEDERVYLELVDGLGRMRGVDVVDQLVQIVVYDSRTWIRERAIVSLGRASNYSAKLANGLSKSDEVELRRVTAHLLVGRIDDETIEFAQRLYEDADPSVRAAIVPAFAEADGTLSEILSASVESEDSVILGAVAVAAGRMLADKQADAAATEDALRLLEHLWESAEESSDVGLSLAVLRAAGRSEPRPEALALIEQGLQHEIWQVRLVATEQLQQRYDDDRHDVLGPATDRPFEDYLELARWASQPRAAIVTVERPGFVPGRFTVRLETSDAPLASRQFATLAERGAFDGITIRRLVPDVALYSGDLSADDAAGIQYDLRDEIDHELFLSGTLAWVSSGRDRSDGSWFLTLSPRPELTGSTTVFARVVQNLSGVAGLLLPSDMVKSVEIYQGDGSEPLPAGR